MKKKLLLIPSLITSLSLVSCEEEETTTVSKSLVSGDTIVSRKDSSGSYTRTQYDRDVFGNKTITTTRGHDNATQQGDLLEVVITGIWSLIDSNN